MHGLDIVDRVVVGSSNTDHKQPVKLSCTNEWQCRWWCLNRSKARIKCTFKEIYIYKQFEPGCGSIQDRRWSSEMCLFTEPNYDFYRSFNQLLHASFGDLNSVSRGLFANRKWIYKIGTKRIGSNAFLMILCFDSHYFMMVYTSQRSIMITHMMVVNGLNMWVLSS